MNSSLTSLSRIEMAEKYMEILFPLEKIVSMYYEQCPEMHDHDVLRVYEALLKDVRAKLTNFPQPQHKLTNLSKTLYEMQLALINVFQKSYSLEEVLQCLKLLEKSVKLWNKELGSRGYLNFISQHF